MKIQISFEIEYDDPKDQEEYNELINEIKLWYSDFFDPPEIESLWAKTWSSIEIDSDYKSGC